HTLIPSCAVTHSLDLTALSRQVWSRATRRIALCWISFLAGFFLIGSARAELDLTPKLSEYELDGVKFKQLAFSDGSNTVTYSPPRGGEYSGGASQLNLRPPGKSQAEAKITKKELTEPAAFDDETVKRIVHDALAAVPRGSTDVQIVAQERNPLMIERKETF